MRRRQIVFQMLYKLLKYVGSNHYRNSNIKILKNVDATCIIIINAFFAGRIRSSRADESPARTGPGHSRRKTVSSATVIILI